MSKNKKLRREIKISIKRLIPKSSAWHNLLSTRYRKNMFERQTNGWLVWKCPCRTRKIHIPTKKHELLKLSRTKILSTATSKCDKQRLKTSARCSLLVCGDIELNPGPLSNHMSVLTIRLARLGLKPVKNCWRWKLLLSQCKPPNLPHRNPSPILLNFTTQKPILFPIL